MVFYISHLDGSDEIGADPSVLSPLIDELEGATDEHPDVSVGLESEWWMSALRGGRVFWENVASDDEPRHMSGLTRAQVLELFELVASEDVESIESRPWLPGYPE